MVSTRPVASSGLTPAARADGQVWAYVTGTDQGVAPVPIRSGSMRRGRVSAGRSVTFLIDHVSSGGPARRGASGGTEKNAWLNAAPA